MKYLWRKLGFIHGRLWRDDETYRAALLVGPAPAVGVILAVMLWGGITSVKVLLARPPQWATPPATHEWSSNSEHPKFVQPKAALPQAGAGGKLVGYEPGWNVSAHPVEIDRTMEVDVKPSALDAFTMSGPLIDLDQIIALGPKQGLFIAIGTGFLVVRQPGIYALSARLDRPGGAPVNCLTRLGFGPNRVMSHVTLDVGSLSMTYDDAAWFDLQPGLYNMAWAFGCWHDHTMAGPGHMTILLRRPGEDALLPIKPEDFVR
jgi:hypothetical protein